MFIRTKENRVEIDPKMLWVPEFKAIWSRDKSKDKRRANREFAYIYFVADYKSEYNVYGIEKQIAVSRDIMGKDEYVPDEIVQAAIEKYEKMQETASMRYLKSVYATVNSLIKFYDELRFKSESSNAMQYDPNPAIKGMKEVELILEKVEKWERKVLSEEDNMQIRGGGSLSMFEDKESATWLKN